MTYEVMIDGRAHRVELQREAGEWLAHVDGREIRFSAEPAGREVLSILSAGHSYEVLRESVPGLQPGEVNIVIASRRYAAEIRDPRALRSRRAAAGAEGPKKILSPMPGKVVRVLATEGTEVAAGAGIIVVEAMKMQNELKSPKQGRIAKLAVSVGAAVNAGDVLAVVE